jgi:hypothetical protein
MNQTDYLLIGLIVGVAAFVLYYLWQQKVI